MSRKLAVFLAVFFALSCGPGADPISNIGVCGNYPDYLTSAYKLPYAAGTAHNVGQANCSGFTHYGQSRYAYDFDMPIGTSIRAARAGTVVDVVESKTDGNGCADGENRVKIMHADGTVAGYYHLTKDGALVNVGDTVTQGQDIGRSGNTGCSTDPHLHFEVAGGDGSIAITFSNTLANPNGLRPGTSYTAQ